VSTTATPTSLRPRDEMYLAVDGDDVGRRFEEQLASCVDAKDVAALHLWSHSIQQELSGYMLDLVEIWDGRFVARTGDGFLAAFPAESYLDLISRFRPRLPGATVTTGIGHSVKEAYLALKLGKARNRGGGILYGFDPPKEELLWDGEAPQHEPPHPPGPDSEE
jgi:hypothetical protein